MKRKVIKHYFISGRKRTFLMDVRRFSKRMSERGKATLYRDPSEYPIEPVLVRIRHWKGTVYHLFEDHLQAWTLVDQLNNGV